MTENEKYIREAIGEAKKRLGFTEPNPAVGALIVKEGQVLSRGFHLGAGHPHAEAEALKNLSQTESQDSTLYVTLEPCCHFGKTPPCTDLIIQSGIKKVVYGLKDPNPLVSGSGVAFLREKNVEVVHCYLKEIAYLYLGYSYWQKTKMPFITLKIAISKDGKMAGLNGKKVKLTSESTDKFTHQMRLESSAILTSANTLNNDNPYLDCRLVSKDKKKVFVADRSNKLKKDLKIFTSAEQVTVLNENNIFKYLGGAGLHNIWVEAGPTFSKSLLSNRLVHRLFVYESSLTLGEGLAFDFDAIDLSCFKLMREFSLGGDLIKEWCVNPS